MLPLKMIHQQNLVNVKVSSSFSLHNKQNIHSFIPFHSSEKGTDETEKFVEYSLQQLRDLPMLTPLEPLIENKEDSDEKKSNYRGEFGDVFIENLHDYYRPNRRAPPIIIPNSLSSLERRYRLCSDRPSSLPSPPLFPNISDKLYELTNDDESIASTSTIADDNMQTDNLHLLQTLSSTCDDHLRSLSPVLITDEDHEVKKFDEITNNDRPIVDGTEKVNRTSSLPS